MPKLKHLSGKEIIHILSMFGFSVNSQRGSHVKMLRYSKNGKQTLTIPNHNELDKGTLKAIIRQSSKYIAIEKIKIHF